MEVQGTFYVFMVTGEGPKVEHLDELVSICEAITAWLHEFVGAKKRIEGRLKKLSHSQPHLEEGMHMVGGPRLGIPFHVRRMWTWD